MTPRSTVYRRLHSGIVACLLLALGTTVAANPDHAQSHEFMAAGQRLLQSSSEIAVASVDAITRSNHLRAQIKKGRARLHALGESEKQFINELLGEQLEVSTELQQTGSRLRASSQQLQRESLLLLKTGMTMRWSEWIENPGALRVKVHEGGDSQAMATAHNAQVRSVNPQMTELMPNPETQQLGGMSLEVSRLAGQRVPKELDFSSFSLSRDQRYLAHIEVESASGDDGLVLINQLHSWRLLITTLDGDPVQNAHIDYTGHMPGHVHGLPTQPRVTAELAPGVYRISGVKFQMRGWWVIELTVSSEQHGDTESPDSIRFHLNL